MGFARYDAIHLTSAEQAKVDVFPTTDNNNQKTADRNKELFFFAIANAMRRLEEGLK